MFRYVFLDMTSTKTSIYKKSHSTNLRLSLTKFGVRKYWFSKHWPTDNQTKLEGQKMSISIKKLQKNLFLFLVTLMLCGTGSLNYFWLFVQ